MVHSFLYDTGGIWTSSSLVTNMVSGPPCSTQAKLPTFVPGRIIRSRLGEVAMAIPCITLPFHCVHTFYREPMGDSDRPLQIRSFYVLRSHA